MKSSGSTSLRGAQCLRVAARARERDDRRRLLQKTGFVLGQNKHVVYMIQLQGLLKPPQQ